VDAKVEPGPCALDIRQALIQYDIHFFFVGEVFDYISMSGREGVLNCIQVGNVNFLQPEFVAKCLRNGRWIRRMAQYAFYWFIMGSLASDGMDHLGIKQIYNGYYSHVFSFDRFCI